MTTEYTFSLLVDKKTQTKADHMLGNKTNQSKFLKITYPLESSLAIYITIIICIKNLFLWYLCNPLAIF